MQGVLSATAARVENHSDEATLSHRSNNRRLRAADIPGGGTVVVRGVPGLPGLLFMAGGPSPAQGTVQGIVGGIVTDRARTHEARLVRHPATVP